MPDIVLQDLKGDGRAVESMLAGDIDEETETEKLGTKEDQRDMSRMGKAQELRRNFRKLALYGYAVVIGCSWPYILAFSAFALRNGGRAGAVWTYIFNASGLATCVWSMAEMASMAPTAGGQYHWVSEFAPERFQKPLSYFVGWLCTLGWQGAMAVGAYTPAVNIQGFIALFVESYALPGWQATLLSWAVITLAILLNSFGLRKLSMLEGIFVALYIIGLVFVLVVLWVHGERASASDVFLRFEDSAGWGNVPLAVMVGTPSSFAALIGGDSACHLSEETMDASYWLPRVMVGGAATNYLIGFLMLVTFMFTLGDLESVLATSTGQPYIQVILNATQSRAWTAGLTFAIIILLFIATINQVTTTSRQLFAFARDKGLPFSGFLAQVHPRLEIPLNALVVTFVFVVLVTIIPCGSASAFNIITSIIGVGLSCSYFVCIGCMAWKRISGERLPPCKFNLGRRTGLIVNICAMLFLLFDFFWLFWPPVPNPTPQTLNWTFLIFAVTVAFSGGYYFFRGRKVYDGPVTYIQKNE